MIDVDDFREDIVEYSGIACMSSFEMSYCDVVVPPTRRLDASRVRSLIFLCVLGLSFDCSVGEMSGRLFPTGISRTGTTLGCDPRLGELLFLCIFPARFSGSGGVSPVSLRDKLRASNSSSLRRWSECWCAECSCCFPLQNSPNVTVDFTKSKDFPLTLWDYGRVNGGITSPLSIQDIDE